MKHTISLLLVVVAIASAEAIEPEAGYYTNGKLAGSLRSKQPLAVYHADRGHLWNRVFAVFYARPSNIPANKSEKPVQRMEGGDIIDFLAWGSTTYFDQPAFVGKVEPLLDDFIRKGHQLIRQPLKRAFMLRDLWAVYDFLADKNIRRQGDVKTRKTRRRIASKLARCIRELALSAEAIAGLPDNYKLATQSGSFVSKHFTDAKQPYLPFGLLSRPNEWVEIDFHQPNLHEDLSNRFITLHTRSYRGRSYFRIFYRYPGGRKAVQKHLLELDKKGVDWKKSAQQGFIDLKKNSPQIPVGSEFALAQFMMTLDNKLRPTPTKILESLRLRAYMNIDGSSTPATNTGVGMNVLEYTLSRRLLFATKRGGLRREPDDMPQYRIIFQPRNARDWGTIGRKVLFQQCADCHMSPRANRTGVRSVVSIVNMGGFDAGAQLGIARPMPIRKPRTRGMRAAKWKRQHETYRRLLEALE